MSLPRKLTASEKTTFLSAFPLLDVDFTIVTDEPTGAYNCISWTVGVTNYWHWPGVTLADFDSFYSLFGLTRKTKGHVAAWGFADNNMTHGCISGPTHGPCWESKCGGLARIRHCLNELNGPSYGHVIAYYSWRRLIVVSLPPYLKKYMRLKNEFTKEEINRLKAMIKEVPVQTATDFEKRFSAWKKIWHTGSNAFSSDPYTRTKTAEYRELVALGKDILPLLVRKLTDESNFLALPAFEELAGKKHIIRINAADEKVLEGEQGRAFRTAKNWLASS